MTKKLLPDWKITDLWNGVLTKQRKLVPRTYIYASELGRSFVDRVLKMRGIKPTNGFSARVLRVFDCGNIYETEVVERMFRLMGILISSQERLVIETPGCLDVVGRHDPRIGGVIDVELARENIADPKNSEWMQRRATAFLEALIEKYPNGLREKISEIKTVNSRAFWAHKNQDEDTGFFKGYPQHKLQLHTYVEATGIPGVLFYISKDDLTLMETPMRVGDAHQHKLWLEDVEKMTEIYNKSNYLPLLKETESGRITIADWLREYQEPNILWSEEKQEYEKNWKASYSSYLTLITNLQDSDAWEMSMKDELKQANIIPCKICEKKYTRSTLNKNEGVCGRCKKKKEKPALDKAKALAKEKAVAEKERAAAEKIETKAKKTKAAITEAKAIRKETNNYSDFPHVKKQISK